LHIIDTFAAQKGEDARTVAYRNVDHRSRRTVKDKAHFAMVSQITCNTIFGGVVAVHTKMENGHFKVV